MKDDADADNDDAGRRRPGTTNDDSKLYEIYGNEASKAEKGSVTVAVKRYFAASVAEHGAEACSLLSPALATALVEGGGQPGGSTGASGGACATAMTSLLKQQHAQLAADDVATMKVTAVRAKGNVALAVLGFRTLPEGEILLRRENGAWKIDALRDSVMP